MDEINVKKERNTLYSILITQKWWTLTASQYFGLILGKEFIILMFTNNLYRSLIKRKKN